MLVEQYIQRIQSFYSHGVQSDDTRLSNLHIYNALLTTRNVLLTQKADKRQDISEWSYQTICVELQLAQPHECLNIPNPAGSRILRSKKKLPKILTSNDKLIIESISSLDGSLMFDLIGWNQNKYRPGNKYVKNKPSAIIRNDYLYVTDERVLEIASVTALFEDFIEASKLEGICVDEENCISPLEVEFRIDGDTAETMIKMVQEELVKDLLQIPEDRFNDAVDNNSNSKR